VTFLKRDEAKTLAIAASFEIKVIFYKNHRKFLGRFEILYDLTVFLNKNERQVHENEIG